MTQRDASPAVDQTDSPAPGWRLRLLGWLAQRPELLLRLAAARSPWQRLGPRGRKRLLRLAGGSAVCAALLLALATTTGPLAGNSQAAIAVDAGVVAVALDNKCSLVEAFRNANNDNRVYNSYGECAAGLGADTINLPGGTFTISAPYGGFAFYSDNGLPPIAGQITINGNGATIERDGSAPAFRLLAVSRDAQLALNDTTITGGMTAAGGGGLYVYFLGEATLNGSTVFGNSAAIGGGIHSKGGTVVITGSTISGNTSGGQGAGIAQNLGSLTINTSTISGNDAVGQGGGLAHLFGTTLTIDNSTIRGNLAGGAGAGLYQLGGSVTLTNATITDNTSGGAGGGVHNRGGTATLTNSTVTGNGAALSGGGLYMAHNLAQMSLVRSLVSGNTAPDAGEIGREAGIPPLAADARNVFGHAGLTHDDAFDNFAPGATDYDATSDEGNVALGDIIGTLGNNGGPTFTHALAAGSPAIDFAPSAACVGQTDQRGYGRNVNGLGPVGNRECDSGAFEFGASLATVTPTPSATAVPSVTTTPSATSPPTTTPTPTGTPAATTTPGPTPTATTAATPTATGPPPAAQSFVPVAMRP